MCCVLQSGHTLYSVTPTQISVLLVGMAGPFETAVEGPWVSSEGRGSVFLCSCMGSKGKGEKYGFNTSKKTDLKVGGNLLFTSLKS